MIAVVALTAFAFLGVRPAILGVAVAVSFAAALVRRRAAVRRCHDKWRRFKAEHPEVFD